ncbi:MAG: tetratricopeptide repeat protein [Rhodocyclaceae bacterium]|nr:tetratricopeptide repeat protein [Rhodocyclaceae bacterium]
MDKNVDSDSIAQLSLAEQFKAAISLVQAGKIDQAERGCLSMLDTMPDYFEAVHLLGMLKLQAQDFELALKYLDRACQLQPQHLETRQYRQIAVDQWNSQRIASAFAMQKAGHFAQAEAIYLAILQLDPNQFDATQLLGVMAMSRRQFELAIEYLNRAIAVNPNFVDGYLNRGTALKGLNRLNEALSSFEQAIALKPEYAEAHNNSGIVLKELNRLDEALASYNRALMLKPDYAEAHNNLGIALKALKRPSDALASYDKALALNPRYAEAHNNRGNALKDLQRMDQALVCYEQAIALNPRYADAYVNRGNALQQLNQFDDALTSYDKALAIETTLPEAHLNRGITLKELHRLGESLASFDQALRFKPDYPEAHNNRGLTFQELKQFDEALASYDQALAIDPDNAAAYFNHGNTLQKMKRFDLALASYENALAIESNLATAHNNRGVALRQLNRHDESLGSFEQALTLKPDYSDAYNNRGLTFQESMQFDAALASYEQALAIDANLPEAHMNQGICYLLMGNFDKGWEQYEWRWKCTDRGGNFRNYAQPQWLGDTDIAGKTILLWAEQGLGDAVQFCRYVQQVAALGANVVLEVPAALIDCVSALPGAPKIIAKGSVPPAFDVHCPLLSLPLAFRTSLADVRGGSYLRASADKLTLWETRIARTTKPRVGIVWQGNPEHKNDANRSIAFGNFQQLIVEKFDYYCLQQTISASDKSILAKLPAVKAFSSELVDFSDTAALVSLMDVVITIDSSVAHLAGALGKEVWILLPHAPDWRWLLKRSDSPWYDSAILFRQPKAGDWDSVLKTVTQQLRLRFGGDLS